eukprot:symbB.v1.2.041498.t1/scaffold8286.1/size18106/1
MRPSINPF